MKKMIGVFSCVVAASVAATIVFAGGGGFGGGGGGGGFGGGGFGGGGRGGGGGGRGNTGDAAPSTNPSAHSLTTPTTPTTRPDDSGFIRRWSILEPIYGITGVAQNAAHANALKEYFPGQMTVIPKDGDKVTVNGSELKWHALDSNLFRVNLVHFGNEFGFSSANDALFWVVTVVNCPQEMKDVRLAIGSNDSSVWWVNGQEACGIYGDILVFPYDAVSKRLTLKKGPNIVLACIHNQRGQTDFCARFLNEAGEPIKDYTVSLSADGN